jgi:hypothetical protein
MSDDNQKGVSNVPTYDEIMSHYMSYLDRLKAREISWKEWVDRYGSLNEEVLGLDSPIVQNLDPHFVWTECSDSESGWIALPGFEIVNRSGYWLSEQPWQDGDQVVVRIAHPSENVEEEEGRPWNEHVRRQAHKQLRSLLQLPDLEVAPGKVAKWRSATGNQPTELQQSVAKAVAAVMNMLLPTAEDHLQVLTIMLSAAYTSAMIISDDVDAGFYEALLERANRVAHSVCLDMYGTHDPHSAAYRHDPQGAAYRARVA